MAKASQIAGRTEAATLDVDGLLINVVFYPDHFSPHVMRQYGSIMALQALFSSMAQTTRGKTGEEAMQEMLSKLDTIEAQLLSKAGDLAEIIVTLLHSWDIEEDVEECEPGAFVALTQERLVKFGFVFLFKFLGQLTPHLQLLGEVKSAPLNGHSSPSSGVKPRRKR